MLDVRKAFRAAHLQTSANKKILNSYILKLPMFLNTDYTFLVIKQT